MSQKKTVFERLEDKMIEMEQNVDAKLAKILDAVDTLKDEIPKSLGQNLMSFTDMLGGKIEDLEDLLKEGGGTGGSGMDLGALSPIKAGINEIKTGINDLKTAIKNIKIEVPPPVISTPATTPRPAPASPPPVTKPVVATPTPSAPAAATPTRPVSTPTSAATPSAPAAPATTSAAAAGGPMDEVLILLDSIKAKAQSGITALQLANEMEQTRDTIVKIFRWHPALYELATFARRLKKSPEGVAVDADLLKLLLEKTEEWKNRISG